MSEVYRVTAVLSDLKVMCMWKKQIERSQMKQWTIDGFVKSQIFKLFQKMENFGRFWKFQGYGRSLLTSSFILYIAKGKTIVIRKHGIY